jgi:lipid II:glycine glycyltransferase (peptidoglycan interpeptide bridge formation enzyme)
MNSSNQTIPKVIIAEDDNNLKGIILIQIQNYFSSLLKSFSSRAVISGGPLFNYEENVLSVLLSEYIRMFKRKVVYTQIRNLFNVESFNHIFEKYSFKRQDHLNYIIDLNDKIDIIWKNVYAKRKNEIRRGMKEGISVKEISYESELLNAYAILELIYKKAKLPLPKYDYFYKARDIMDGDIIFRVFGGYFENKLIGVMFLLCFNGRVYNWYAASNPDYYKIYPNDVITWEVIIWALENGFKIFDFGGAGNPDQEYGVRDFKKKFGGTEVNYGRYECIHNPIIMKLSEHGFKLWQKLK